MMKEGERAAGSWQRNLLFICMLFVGEHARIIATLHKYGDGTSNRCWR